MTNEEREIRFVRLLEELRALASEKDGNLVKHAEREGVTDGEVLDLVRLFSLQGHSGGSAPPTVACFAKVAMYGVLGPLTGEDDEWTELDYGGDMAAQNKRCSHVFKREDGTAYDIDGRIFREPNGSCYTSGESRVDVTFPYTPTREYVDVPASSNEAE